jgi:hypothetical protein
VVTTLTVPLAVSVSVFVFEENISTAEFGMISAESAGT